MVSANGTMPAPVQASASGPAMSHPVEELSLTDLIVLRSRLNLLRRLAWLQHLWGGRECPETWGWQLNHPDTPAAQSRWSSQAPETHSIESMLTRCERKLQTQTGARRQRLVRLFKLSTPELDCLDLAFALHEEPTLPPLLRAVSPHGAQSLTEVLVRQVFCHERDAAPVYRPGGGLSIWGLIQERALAGASRGLSIDPAIAAYLKGSLSLDPVLVSCARLTDPSYTLEYWTVQEHAARLDRILRSGQTLRCVVRARKGDKPLAFASALCEALGIRLLSVCLPRGADAVTQGNVATRAERLALLGHLAIAWQGLDWQFHPTHLSAAPLQFHLATDGETPAGLRGSDRIDWVIDLSSPPKEDRVTFCRQVIEGQRGLSTLSEDELHCLSHSNAASLDDLETALSKAPANLDEAQAYLSECLVQSDEPLTGQISAPRRDWSDIVLPEATLETLQSVVFEATERAKLAASSRTRSKKQGGALAAGMPILLHGPPGTGKTLAAEIIAAQMGCNLYTVDVAAIISKYVGETAKNLRRIFFEARNRGNVLFFDEADTFFVKRTEVRGANDKYANADTNYLLQLTEAHPGTTILATNRRADIDPAFFRRMRYIIELVRPAAAQRQVLWEQCLERLALCAADLPEGFLTALAQGIELSPAQIRNSVTSVYFLMRKAQEPLTPPLLLQALTRELSKEGRVLGKRDLERLARHE